MGQVLLLHVGVGIREGGALERGGGVTLLVEIAD